jgi:hypothetical protein
VEKIGARLVVGQVHDSIDWGRVKEEKGPYASRTARLVVNQMHTSTDKGRIDK